jgi:hypothetical protein
MIEEHKRFLEKQERYANEQEYIEPAIAELEAALGDALINVEYSYSIDISVSGAGHHLTAVFRILKKHGWDLPSARPEANDPTYTAWFYPSDTEGRKVIIWLYFSSTVCKRVQVGTEIVTEERAIYEVVCE